VRKPNDMDGPTKEAHQMKVRSGLPQLHSSLNFFLNFGPFKNHIPVSNPTKTLFSVLALFYYVNHHDAVLNWVGPFTLARLSAMLNPRRVPGVPCHIESCQIPWHDRDFGHANSSGVTQLAYKGAAHLPLFFLPFLFPHC
jgi:hypothetical protein